MQAFKLFLDMIGNSPKSCYKHCIFNICMGWRWPINNI